MGRRALPKPEQTQQCVSPRKVYAQKQKVLKKPDSKISYIPKVIPRRSSDSVDFLDWAVATSNGLRDALFNTDNVGEVVDAAPLASVLLLATTQAVTEPDTPGNVHVRSSSGQKMPKK